MLRDRYEVPYVSEVVHEGQLSLNPVTRAEVGRTAFPLSLHHILAVTILRAEIANNHIVY